VGVTTDPRLALSLADYQKSLDQALAAPDTTSEAFIGVSAQDAEGQDHPWLVPLAALTEVGLVQHVSRLGRMPTRVVGLSNFRGQPRTLLDTPALLGYPVEQEAPWALILKENDMHVALLWPGVVGIFSLNDFPETKTSNEPWVHTWRRDKKGQVWGELDIPGLLNHLRKGPLAQETTHE
jgi:chemotaxis signal transduction protein